MELAFGNMVEVVGSYKVQVVVEGISREPVPYAKVTELVAEAVSGS